MLNLLLGAALVGMSGLAFQIGAAGRWKSAILG